MPISGECFCGSIRYTIGGPLKDPLACHCSRCRKAFSAQSSNYARLDSSDFQWTCGEEMLTSYTGESGIGLLFCRACGSTLCGTVDGKVHGVTLGCLNDNPDIDDIHHLFVDSRAAWDVMPQGVTQFPEGRKAVDRRK